MQAADNLAYTIASRYSRKNVVTARVNELNFLAPVKVGDVVIMDGRIARVGHSSMVVDISISGEDLKTGHRFDVAQAIFTMVAVDEAGRPIAVNQNEENKQ